MIVDVGANPRLGFRTGFTIIGWAVIGCGMIGAVLMNPERDPALFHARSEVALLPEPVSVVKSR